MNKEDIKEAGRIVNAINDLKIKLNEVLDFSDRTGMKFRKLQNYVRAIDKAEADLLDCVKLPHCEWAE